MADILKRRVALGAGAEEPSLSLSELYHENSKLRPLLGPAAGAAGEFSVAELQAMAHAYKQYRLYPPIPLPPASDLPPGDQSFDKVVAARRTGRSFAREALELEELAKVLYQTYGITGEARIPGGGVQPFRAAPSGGALYPAELYLGVRLVNGVPPGIYHYEVPSHALASLRPGDPTQEFYEVCCRQEYAREAGVIVLISAVLERTKRKYGERGYRYVLLDIGHLAQNLCLSCTALGLAVMTSCAFLDDAANGLLRIDGVEEAVLYSAFIGKTATTRSGGVPISVQGVEGV